MTGSGLRSGLTCRSCSRSPGATVYVVEGLLGTYVECEWCHDGIARPVLPELITESFREPPDAAALVRIVDKLCGPVWV